MIKTIFDIVKQFQNQSEENKTNNNELLELQQSIYENIKSSETSLSIDFQTFIKYFDSKDKLAIFRTKSTANKISLGVQVLDELALNDRLAYFLLWRYVFKINGKINVVELFNSLDRLNLNAEELSLQDNLIALKQECIKEYYRKAFLNSFSQKLLEGFLEDKSKEEKQKILVVLMQLVENEQIKLKEKQLIKLYSTAARNVKDKKLLKKYFRKRFELSPNKDYEYYLDLHYYVANLERTDDERYSLALEVKAYFDTTNNESKKASINKIISFYEDFKSKNNQESFEGLIRSDNIEDLKRALSTTKDVIIKQHILQKLANVYRKNKDLENSYQIQKQLAKLNISNNITRNAYVSMVKRALEIGNIEYLNDSLNKLCAIEQENNFKDYYSNKLKAEAKLKGFIKVFDIDKINLLDLECINVHNLSDNFHFYIKDFNPSLYEKDAAKIVYDISNYNNNNDDCKLNDIEFMMCVLAANKLTYYEYFRVYPKNNRHLIMRYDMQIASKSNPYLASLIATKLFKEVSLNNTYIAEWLIYLSSICDSHNIDAIWLQDQKELESDYQEIIKISKALVCEFFEYQNFVKLSEELMKKSAYFSLEEKFETGENIDKILYNFNENYNFLGAFKYLELLMKSNKRTDYIANMYNKYKAYSEELDLLMKKEYFPRENTNYRKAMIFQYILNNDEAKEYFEYALNDETPCNAFALSELLKLNLDDFEQIERLILNNRKIIQEHIHNQYFLSKLFYIHNELRTQEEQARYKELLSFKKEKISEENAENEEIRVLDDVNIYDNYLYIYEEQVLNNCDILELIKTSFNDIEYKKVLCLGGYYFLKNEPNLEVLELYLKALLRTTCDNNVYFHDAFGLIKAIINTKNQASINAALFALVFSNIDIFTNVFASAKKEFFDILKQEINENYDNYENLLANFKQNHLNLLSEEKKLILAFISEAKHGKNIEILNDLANKVYDKYSKSLMMVFINSLDTNNNYQEKSQKIQESISEIDKLSSFVKDNHNNLFSLVNFYTLKTELKQQLAKISNDLLDLCAPNLSVELDEDGIFRITNSNNSSDAINVLIMLKSNQTDEEITEEIEKLGSAESFELCVNEKGKVKLSYNIKYNYKNSKGIVEDELDGELSANIDISDEIDVSAYNTHNKYFLNSVDFASRADILCFYNQIPLDEIKQRFSDCIDIDFKFIKDFDSFVKVFNDVTKLDFPNNIYDFKEALSKCEEKILLIRNLNKEFEMDYFSLLKDNLRIFILDDFGILNIYNDNITLEKDFNLITEKTLNIDEIIDFFNSPKSKKMIKNLYIKEKVANFILEQTNGVFELVKALAINLAKKLNERELSALTMPIIKECINEFNSDDLKALLFCKNDSKNTRESKIESLQSILEGEKSKFKSEFVSKKIITEEAKLMIKMFEKITNKPNSSSKSAKIEKINNLCKNILIKLPNTFKTTERYEKITKMINGDFAECVKNMYIVFYEDTSKARLYPTGFNNPNKGFIMSLRAIRNKTNHTDCVLEEKFDLAYKDLCQKVLNKAEIIDSFDEENMKDYLVNELIEFLQSLYFALEKNLN